eukprot:m.65181 g.65181  ORF g.65181 m.65181 type:complete len:601 (-) comp7311_c0_seq1:217-2019(-)
MRCERSNHAHCAAVRAGCTRRDSHEVLLVKVHVGNRSLALGEPRGLRVPVIVIMIDSRAIRAKLNHAVQIAHIVRITGIHSLFSSLGRRPLDVEGILLDGTGIGAVGGWGKRVEKERDEVPTTQMGHEVILENRGLAARAAGGQVLPVHELVHRDRFLLSAAFGRTLGLNQCAAIRAVAVAAQQRMRVTHRVVAESEQIPQILDAKLGAACCAIIDDGPADALLADLPLKYFLLNRARGEETVDVHRTLLPIAPDSRHGLNVRRGIPVDVEHHEARRAGDVEPNAAGLGAEQKDEVIRVLGVELVHDCNALRDGRGALQADGLEGELLADGIEHVEALGRVGHDQHPLRRRGLDTLQDLHNNVEFAGDACIHDIAELRDELDYRSKHGRVLLVGCSAGGPGSQKRRAVAKLFERGNADQMRCPAARRAQAQLNHVAAEHAHIELALQRRWRAEHDILVLVRQVLVVDLLRATQAEHLDDAVQLGRAPAAQRLLVGRRLRLARLHNRLLVHAPKGRQVSQNPWAAELDNGEELLQIILDRCTGQGNSTSCRQARDGRAGLGAGVLEAMGLVAHEHVEGDGLDGVQIAQHHLVRDNHHRVDG